ncbi:hypothetical protein EYR38_002050 [Pleurotus pulmonarius]|nr:hypothetical protein EYR38_002030 [Pleurotus pulmonarius]KAF4584819.1 hypothetical protein EYR38_002050 [Pleurotus pulmonarius]
MLRLLIDKTLLAKRSSHVTRKKLEDAAEFTLLYWGQEISENTHISASLIDAWVTTHVSEGDGYDYFTTRAFKSRRPIGTIHVDD